MKEEKSICPRCSAGFSCDIAMGAEKCWCFELPALQKIARPEVKSCFCPQCLQLLLAQEKKDKGIPHN